MPNDIYQTLIEHLQKTSTSLGESLSAYWPAIRENDPAERNVSLHFSHHLLSSGFHVIGEGRMPNEKSAERIDVLGFSCAHDWFVGCEFKRLYGSHRMQSLCDDIERLRRFWPITNFPSARYGERYEQLSVSCRAGFGIVGGLHATRESSMNSPVWNVWLNQVQPVAGAAYTNAASTLRAAGAQMIEPMHVVSFPTGWKYHLFCAVFPIPRPVI